MIDTKSEMVVALVLLLLVLSAVGGELCWFGGAVIKMSESYVCLKCR